MANCSICQKSLQDAYELCCRHSFHESCILALKAQKKSCPDCGKPIEKQCFTALELFSLLYDMQCKSCKTPNCRCFKLTDTGVDLKYILNHQCYDCQYVCRFFKQAPTHKEGVQALLQNMEKLDWGAETDEGKSLSDQPTRSYDKYDFLYCNTCDQAVIKFHAESKEYLEKRAPTERVVKRLDDNVCPDCKEITWKTLHEKTHQKLPKCGACHKLVQRHEWYERFCCRPQPFHLECSRKHRKCPKCDTDCVIKFDISKDDPTMTELLVTEILPALIVMNNTE